MSRTGRMIASAWICLALVGVLLLLSRDPGTENGVSLLAQVPLVLFIPVLITGYIIGILRNMAEDSRAIRRELEAIRVELTRHRVGEPATDATDRHR